jgi:hypothetical protein
MVATLASMDIGELGTLLFVRDAFHHGIAHASAI